MPVTSLINRVDDSLRELWPSTSTQPDQQVARLRTMERNIGLPVKLIVIGFIFHYLFISDWSFDATIRASEGYAHTPPSELAMQGIRQFFIVYLLLNLAVTFVLHDMDQFKLSVIQSIVYVTALVDGLFLSALALVTGGFNTLLFWIFPGLIIRNAVSTPIATRQILLNLLVTLFFALAGVGELSMAAQEEQMIKTIAGGFESENGGESGAEPVVLRTILLLLMTFCCYGVQVLFDKQQRADEEAQEFELRQHQLQAAGRLAAEIAHQLKNPLGIINNAVFSLQRANSEGKPIDKQVDIIREEVSRSDQILTELMGYAKLSEGQVEKISVKDILETSLRQVFPPGANYDVEIHKHYALALPNLLVHRAHIQEVFVNLLQNAREAMQGKGRIDVTTESGQPYAVVVRIQDNGPGIATEKAAHIFDPYFTTKAKGTGLGLAIVKHNVEIYGGTVSVESELGKGTQFTLYLPGKMKMKLQQ